MIGEYQRLRRATNCVLFFPTESGVAVLTHRGSDSCLNQNHAQVQFQVSVNQAE